MNEIGILLGLAAALSYGASDFMGGIGGRRASVGSVVLVQQPFALLATIIVWAVYRPSGPTAGALGWGALSGLGNGLGTVALYRGLALGRMSVVAPLSARSESVWRYLRLRGWSSRFQPSCWCP